MTPARGFRGGDHQSDHEAYDELAVGWALHALEPEDEALFGLHLPDCARCGRTVAETSEVMAALAEDLPDAEPHDDLRDDLRDRIRAAVEQTEQVRRPPPPSVPPLSLPDDAPRPPAASPVRRTAPAHPWRPTRVGPAPLRDRLPQALLAAAAAVVIGLGVWNVVLSTTRQQAEQTAAAQQQVIDALLAPGQATIAPLSAPDGHRVATVIARPDRLQVVTSGLRVNDEASTTYVVWGMRQKSPVALGTFDVVDPRLDLRAVGSDHTGLDGFTGYAISLEHGRKPPAKPTQIVANGQVTS